MRRWWWALVVLGAIAIGVMASRLDWFRGSRVGPKPLPVESGDQEIAWLHNPTSYETWENFVWGAKRAEMAGEGPSGLEVDDSGAYPHRTTAVPEIVIRRKGFTGSLRIRWYKVADEPTQEAWVNALAARDPPPIAVLGGWSSDRAKELADAMRDAKWSGPKPLLFLAQATAEKVDPDQNSQGAQTPALLSIYERSFRFCFTNRQMAEAVTDFVFSDPTLRPGSIAKQERPEIPAIGTGGWSALGAILAERARPPVTGFALQWMDDPYSTDLSYKFREALRHGSGPATGVPLIQVTANKIPFSTGRLNRATRAETEAAEYILENMPAPGTRTVVVVPTVSAPARRTLRALVQANPAIGHQVVALTGDGIGVNTFFRDRDFAWPVRSLPIPVVLFTHADPFAWDVPGGQTPPRDYELPPPEPGGVRSSTEDIQLFTRLIRVVASGMFPDGTGEMVQSPDSLGWNLKRLTPAFFDATGNRLSGTGEQVVVLRPAILGDNANGRPQSDGVLEVYSRQAGSGRWNRIHTQSLDRPYGGHAE